MKIEKEHCKDCGEEKIQELTESIQRLQADFENFKKREEKQREDYKKQANVELISKLFIIIDNIEISLMNSENKEAFVEGIKLIFADLFHYLRNCGLYMIKAEGEKFDPNFHEAIMKDEETENGDSEWVVTEVFQKGYMFNGRVLRPAKVKIGRKK